MRRDLSGKLARVKDFYHGAGAPRPKVGPENEEQLLWLARLSYCVMLCVGMINAICVWGMDSPAPSGMSGNIRKFSSKLVGPEWYHSYREFCCPICFTSGVAISGIWTNRKVKRSLSVASKCVFLTGIMVLFVAAIVSQGEWPQQREVMYICCLAMGLQGGMMKVTTGFADTTGISGTCTDIGLIIGQAVNPQNRTPKLASKLMSLVALLSCFILGSFLGAMILAISHFADVKYLKMQGTPDRVPAGDRVVALALSIPGALLVALGVLSYCIAVHKIVPDVELREPLPNPAGSTPAEMPSVDVEPSVDVKKAVDQQKNAMVRTAEIGAFFTGAANYVITDLISERGESASHVTGPVYRLGIGVADVVMQNDDILLKRTQASEFVFPGMLTLLFWLFGAILSGVATRSPEYRNYTTGARILIVVGALLLIYGALGYFGMHFLLQVPCTFFSLLNGTMSSTTGFARTGHFTGVLMNIGLLFGQLSNAENITPDVRLKLRQSLKLVLCWAGGTASQSFICKRLMRWKATVFSSPWAYLILLGAGLVLLGSVRLRCHTRRVKALLEEAHANAPIGVKRKSVALMDTMALKALQDEGMAGGFTLDVSMYPTMKGNKSFNLQTEESAGIEMSNLDQQEK